MCPLGLQPFKIICEVVSYLYITHDIIRLKPEWDLSWGVTTNLHNHALSELSDILTHSSTQKNTKHAFAWNKSNTTKNGESASAFWTLLLSYQR